MQETTSFFQSSISVPTMADSINALGMDVACPGDVYGCFCFCAMHTVIDLQGKILRHSVSRSNTLLNPISFP